MEEEADMNVGHTDINPVRALNLQGRYDDNLLYMNAMCRHIDLPFSTLTHEFFNSKSTKIYSELAEVNFLPFLVRN